MNPSSIVMTKMRHPLTSLRSPRLWAVLTIFFAVFAFARCGNTAFFGQSQQYPAAAQDDNTIGLNGSAEDDYVQNPPDAFGDESVAAAGKRMFANMEHNGGINEELLDTLNIPTADVFDIGNYQEYVNRLNSMGVLKEHVERTEILDVDDGLDGYSSISYFIHASDSQIRDTESPLSLNAFKAVANWGLIPASFHPNNPHIVHQMDDIIKTLRGIKNVVGRDYDFLIFSGDFIDISQYNEMRWGMEVMDGGHLLHPDSGADNDPISGYTEAGLPNDPFDKFHTHGMHIPWYLTFGNHDGLYAGNFPITEDVMTDWFGVEITWFEGTRSIYNDIATGNKAYLGYSPDLLDLLISLGDPVQTIVPDSDRYVLKPNEIRNELYNTTGQPDGHGMAENNNKLYYAYDAPGGQVRMISLSTIAKVGPQGFMSEDQYDWLEDELQAAMTKKQLVILSSHHPPHDVYEIPVFSTIVSWIEDIFNIDDGVSESDLKDLLHSYPNVVAWLVAHTHQVQVEPVLAPDNASNPENSYWEINSGSWVTWPQQARVIEVAVDYENLNGKLITTMVNHEGDADRIGNQGRYLSYLEIKDGLLDPSKEGDYINPSSLFLRDLEDMEGTDVDQNVVLNFKLPASWGSLSGSELIDPVGPNLPRVIPSVNYSSADEDDE